MPLTSGFTSRVALKSDRRLPTIGAPFVKVLKGFTRLPWDESNRERQPAGAPGGKGGEFAKSKEAPANLQQGKLIGPHGTAPVQSVAEQNQRFKELKVKWAVLNNDLLKHQVDSPEAQALTKQQKEITKEIYSMNVDSGTVGLEDLGKPGGVRDVVIIGAGPGGMNAAIHGGVEGYDTLLIDASTDYGGQSQHSARIENVPQAGFPAGVNGHRLADGMFEAVKRSRADTLLGVAVTELSYDPETEIKTLKLSNGTTVQARVVILAAGLRARQLGVPGSDSPDVYVLDGKSLADHSKNEHAIVYGGSNGAAQAALDVAREANKVTLLSRSPLNKGMSDYQETQVTNHPKIEVVHDEIAYIETNQKGEVVAAVLKSSKKRIAADEIGLFLGGLPNTEWLPDSIERVDPDPTSPRGGRVVTDGEMETTMPGVFAVGDIRESSEPVKRQPGAIRRAKENRPKGSNGRITAAVGDAAIAIRNAHPYFRHLAALEKQRSTASKSDHWAEAMQRKSAMKDELFTLYDDLAQLDLDNPWYQQTVEPDVDGPKKAVDMPIVLKSEEQQIVYGEVYAPNRPDAQGEFMTAVDIQKMAHEFIRSGKMGQIDLMHGNKVLKGASVVESFVSDDDDKRFLPGSWVIGVHIPDSILWGSIKKGEINGFSMEALVTRHDREVEVEIPPVVTGLTSKWDGHEHKFFVHYDVNGQFKGGVTDTVNGHFHSIVAGTHTQDASGHRHRFSSVDNVRILS